MSNSNINRKGFALVTAASLAAIVLYTIEKIGVPRSYGIALTATASIALWIWAVMPGGTTQAGRFQFANRSVPMISAMLSLLCALGLPLLLVQGGQLSILSPGALATVSGSIVSGIALSTILTSRPFRLSEYSDLGELLNERYGNPVPGGLLSLILLVALLLLLATGLKAATQVSAWFLGTQTLATMVFMLALTAFVAVIGGINSILRLGAMALPLLLIGINLPLFLLTLEIGGLPLGHFGFGSNALEPLWDLEDQLRSLNIATLDMVLTGSTLFANLGASVQVSAGLLIACALIAFPPVMHIMATTHSPASAGRAGVNAILAGGFLFLSLFAYLMYAQYGFYQTMLGLPVSEARFDAPVFYSWSARSDVLISLCNVQPADIGALLSACPDGMQHVISTNELSISGPLFLAGSADLNGFPLAVTALLVVPIVLVLMTFSAALALSASNTLTGAFYAHTAKATGSARVFWNRLLATCIVAAGGLLASSNWFQSEHATFLGLSILAATALPAWLCAIYLPETGRSTVGFSMGAGFAVTVLYSVLAHAGVDLIAENGDEAALGLLGLTDPLPWSMGGLFGLMAAMTVAIAGSIANQMQKSGQASTAEGNSETA